MKHTLVRITGWGITLAVLLGLQSVVTEISDQYYLYFHLYYNCLLVLMRTVDRLLPLTFGLVLVLLFVSMRIRGAILKRVLVRLVLPVLILGGMVAYARLAYHHEIDLFFIDVVPSLRRAVPVIMQRSGKLLLTPSTLFIAIASVALVLVCWSKWRSRPITESRPVSFAQRWWRLYKGAAGFIAGCLALVTAAFIVLHLIGGAFRVRNAVTLRDKPNVIFIMVDTLRADHVGSYGYDLPTTPNIDRLARESTRFEHAVSQAPFTPWSVASLMTSRYPDTIYQIDGPLFTSFNSYFPTLAETLREQGYSTNAVISNPTLKRDSGYEQGFDVYDDRPSSLRADESVPTSEAVTDLALQRLSGMKNRKFALYLLYMDPHEPYTRRKGFEFGESKLDRLAEARLEKQYGPALIRDRLERYDKYNSEIGYTDYHIGRFLDGLKRQGLYDDTLIVFFSDHGEEFFEHGSFGHIWRLYEESIQVPLLVKLPHQRRGKIVRGTFPLIDLYPSLMADLRINVSNLGLQGDAVNLPSVLQCADKPVFSSTFYTHCAMNGGYKFITTDKKRVTKQLFDLRTDRWETHNLLPAQRALASGFIALQEGRDRRRLPSDYAIWKKIVSPEYQKKTAAETGKKSKKADLDRLRTLGYAN